MTKRVLVISNIAWDFVWQRHQTLASLFASEYDVTFLELPGLRRVGSQDALRILSRAWVLARSGRAAVCTSSRVQIIRPWVLPATNSLFVRWNRRALRAALRNLAGGVETVVAYSPTRSALDVIDFVPHRRLIYDCTDNWSAVCGVPPELLCSEGELLQRATLTLVPSQRLLQRHRSAAARIELLPHGATLERFRTVANHPPPKKPLTLLYYGHLHGQHLDIELLRELAHRRPDWNLILVGPLKTRTSFPSNVQLPGQQLHEVLASWVQRAHVLLLPYVINEYTDCVLPAKIFECLATGRPIVGAPLPELVSRFHSSMHFASNVSEYEREVLGAIETDTAEARAERIALAEANSWSFRYEQIKQWLGEDPNK